MNLNYALGYFFQSLKESLLKGQNPGKKLYCTIVKKKKKKVKVIRNRVVEN